MSEVQLRVRGKYSPAISGYLSVEYVKNQKIAQTSAIELGC